MATKVPTRSQENGKSVTKSSAENMKLSTEHVANPLISDQLASAIDLDESEWARLSGMLIGMSGAISAGKTTFGASVVAALKEHGLRGHFSPEQVNAEALSLYISNQRVPEWFSAMSPDEQARVKYNNPFFVRKKEASTTRGWGVGPGGAGVENSQVTNPYATPFQVLMLADCQHRVRECQLFLSLCPNGVAIVDRSAQDNTVFEEANRKLYGAISETDHAFYELVMGNAPAFGVDALIYLDVPPQVTLDRIALRGSGPEKAYQMTYMTFLHDIWFNRLVENFTETPKVSSFNQEKFGPEEVTGPKGKKKSGPFPIFVVNWSDFSTCSISRVLRRVIDPNPRLPRIHFYRSTDKISQIPFGAWATFVTMDWTTGYQLASHDARSAFKKKVISHMEQADCILFTYRSDDNKTF